MLDDELMMFLFCLCDIVIIRSITAMPLKVVSQE